MSADGFDRAQRAHDNATPPDGEGCPADVPTGVSFAAPDGLAGGDEYVLCGEPVGRSGWCPEHDDGPDPDDARDRAYDAQMVD